MDCEILYAELPVMKPVPDTGEYELVESMKIVYKRQDGTTRAVRAPIGFRTDGASIPRILWEEVGSPFDPKFITAAIAHDLHCHWFDGVIKVNDKTQVSLDEMSDLFFALLRWGGVSLVKSLTMEKAVYVYKGIF